MLSLLSKLYEIVYVLASQITIALLHDVKGDFGQFLIITINCCFDFFKLQSAFGFIFDELDLSFDFFEERFQLDGKVVPGFFAFSDKNPVLFLKSMQLMNVVAMF